MDNLLVHATERPAYGFTDLRAIFGSYPEPKYWNIIWMAVSCCCGIEGRTRPADHLPLPDPRLPEMR